MDWVPIVEQPYTLSLGEERGYWMRLGTSATPVTARVYVDAPPATAFTYDLPAVNVYVAGQEDQLGPIQQVTIPVTFATAAAGTTPVLSGANSVVSALYSPSDSGFAVLTSATNAGITLNFGVSYFSGQLTGKRILNVEFLTITDPSPTSTGINANLVSSAASVTMAQITEVGLPQIATNADTNIQTVQMGEYTPFWGTTTALAGDTYPWNYSALLRMDPSTSAAQRVGVTVVETTGTGVSVNMYYAALRVTYCAETRIAMGARSSGAYTPQLGWGPKGTAFSIPLLDVTYSFAPTLSVGDYVVTATYGTYPDAINYYIGDEADIGALHQLYELPKPGIHGINITKLLQPGDVRQAVHTDQIPAISLHTAGAVVPESHGYYQQIAAPVYSGVTAQQGIINNAAIASTSYNLARIYARRFGPTDSPLGLREVGGSGASTLITVPEFDALPEIADGWKQVDFDFQYSPPIPTFTTTGVSTWEAFSSTAAGGQWQVLGARAPNVTGLNFAQVGPNQWLPPTTYGGTTAEATWDQGSGTATLDRPGDLVMMFASVPTVTGFSIDARSLPVTANIDCVDDPLGIPTGIFYEELGWSTGSLGVYDTFSRTVSNGWGTADSGLAWNLASGTASEVSVNGSVGVITSSTINNRHILHQNVPMLNGQMRALISSSQEPVSTGSVAIQLRARILGLGTYVFAELTWGSTGFFQLQTGAFVSGGQTSSGSIAAMVDPPQELNTQYWMAFEFNGNWVGAKVWKETDDEPPDWQVSTVLSNATNITTVGPVGVYANIGLSYNGPTPVTFTFDDFSANPMPGLGAWEIQRTDRWTDYQTIMAATSFANATFNDFEARVGVESTYQVRLCHELDFCGNWSSSVADTVPEPGVEGDGVDGSVLIFTSNTNQDGAGSLAHVAVWEGTPSEEFGFIEAGGVRFQPMYNRDYQVAYHGTERGGETFDRILLMNNAAVNLINYEQLFSSLRDLAWDQLPYIAVRDEHGSRWLANVRVPGGTVQPPSRIPQFAQVAIAEVTGTAYPVDPQ
jgi:hypothetical protein